MYYLCKCHQHASTAPLWINCEGQKRSASESTSACDSFSAPLDQWLDWGKVAKKSRSLRKTTLPPSSKTAIDASLDPAILQLVLEYRQLIQGRRGSHGRWHIAVPQKSSSSRMFCIRNPRLWFNIGLYSYSEPLLW